MKLFFKLTAMLMLGSFLFAACNHKDAPGTTPPPTPVLSVDKTTITQAATAGTISFAVTSNVTWKITCSATWAIVSSGTGSNNGTITITIAANEGTTIRTADITVAPSESGSSLTPQVIKITQGGSAPYVMVDKTTVSIAGAGGTQDVVVTSNVAWSLGIPSTASFITPDMTSGVAGQITVHYTVAANTTAMVKTADVTYTATGVPAPATTSFTQSVDYKLTGFSPASAAIGSSITLTGIFAANPLVQINGTTATSVSLSTDSKTITCTIPAGASSGKITVTSGSTILTSATDFVVYGINSFSPKTLQANDYSTPIIITGGFDVAELPVVKINGTQVGVIANNATSISVVLPYNPMNSPTDGRITVEFGGNTYTSLNNFSITNRWEKVSDGFNGFYVGNIAFTLNNKIYLGSGSDGNGNTNATFQIFDPLTKMWSQGPMVPPGMKQVIHGSCFVLDNIAYMGFGQPNLGFPVSDWWSYNPSGVGTWTPLTSYPVAGMDGIAFVVNNAAYAGLPYSDAGNIRQFDVHANSDAGYWFSKINNPLLSTATSACFFTIGNDEYLMGGFDASRNDLSSVYRINFSTSLPVINRVADLPVASHIGAGFSLNGFGYFINGNVLYKYDPSSNTWSDLMNTLPISVASVYNVQVISGIAYAIGFKGETYKFIP